jgi:hypothetical protein
MTRFSKLFVPLVNRDGTNRFYSSFRAEFYFNINAGVRSD